MDSQLSLSLLEIIVLMLGAIILGITIHFFIVSRRSLKASSPLASEKISKELEEWKLRYFNDVELRDKEIATLRDQLEEATENTSIYAIESEEIRKKNKELHAEMESLRQSPAVENKPGYMEQLRQAQTNLKEYNDKINQLLGQIDIVKEAEEKQQDILRNNEQLSGQVDELKGLLSQKEKELRTARQKQELTIEMSSTIDSVYSEFNVLQEKIQKLESQVTIFREINLGYEDLKEEYNKVKRELEQQQLKYHAAARENQQLQMDLAETGEKLRESNYQRQQLQKRIAYLEELNNDMLIVADANKKLENQLKRIGELESQLHLVAEERDELARKRLNIP